MLITYTFSHHARNLHKTVHINNLCSNPIPINIWKRYKHCVGIAVRGLRLPPLQAPERQAYRLHPLTEAVPVYAARTGRKQTKPQTNNVV
jgi:hypothetical protein